MVSFDYDICSKSVSFKFRCPVCGNISESDVLPISSPNYNADNQSDSEVREDFQCVCKNCGSAIDGELVSGIYYGTVVLPEIDNDAIIETHCEDYEEDYEDYGFYTDAHQILEKIDMLPPELRPTLCRLLYANAVSYLEAYLCNTIKSMALRDDVAIKRFVVNCDEFKRRKLTLDKIFVRKENIEKEIRKYLNGLVYHRFPIIRKLYKNCLSIEIGDMKRFEDIIKKRHDIVHRNGQTIEGDKLEITKDDVIHAWDEVSEVIQNIESERTKLDVKKKMNEAGIDVGF